MTLVVFYSKTGNTMHIGKEIAKILKADVDRIIDKKEGKGVIGYVISGFKALLRKETDINFNKDPTKYDLVVIGSPVWAGRIPPAVRTYLKRNKFRKIAFFSTKGGSPVTVFPLMEELSSKPEGTLDVLEKNISNSEKEIREFCNKLKRA